MKGRFYEKDTKIYNIYYISYNCKIFDGYNTN